MTGLIADMPWSMIIILCLTLGLAPFAPQPHIVEKLRMFFSGTLHRPLDIVDLCFHALPFLLALAKLGVTFFGKQ